MDERCVQVVTTFGTKEEALRVAASVVEARLAACVQVLGPIHSVYRWKDDVRSEEEWMAVAKTTRPGFEALSDAIRASHAYEVPEITAVPIEAGLPEYLQWIRAEVAPGHAP